MIFRYLINLSPLRHALNLWIILAVAVCLKSAIVGGDYSSVYPMFAGASHHWWADQSLYGHYANLDGFRYSPVFAIAFTPFDLLPNPIGPMAWSLVSIGVLVWAMRVLARNVLPGDWPPRREGWFLGLALVGSIVGIWALQTNALVTALLALALASIVRERWWAASLCLAVPVFIKLWPIALVMLLVVFWPRQLSWRFALMCVVLAAIPFLTRPPSTVLWQYHEWYVDLTGPLQGRWPGYRDAWTIWETLCSLFHGEADWNRPAVRHVYMSIQLATSAVVLAWCLWQSRRSRSTGHLLTLIFSMWASWQLLFGPATEQLTYGIIAPSASWAVLVSVAERRARWLTTTVWATFSLLPAGDIEQPVLAVFPGGQVLLPLGVALFVVWLVWHERDAVDALRRHGEKM
jgi:alpha-1,2-mannosyltransferase